MITAVLKCNAYYNAHVEPAQVGWKLHLKCLDVLVGTHIVEYLYCAF